MLFATQIKFWFAARLDMVEPREIERERDGKREK